MLYTRLDECFVCRIHVCHLNGQVQSKLDVIVFLVSLFFLLFFSSFFLFVFFLPSFPTSFPHPALTRFAWVPFPPFFSFFSFFPSFLSLLPPSVYSTQERDGILLHLHERLRLRLPTTKPGCVIVELALTFRGPISTATSFAVRLYMCLLAGRSRLPGFRSLPESQCHVYTSVVSYPVGGTPYSRLQTPSISPSLQMFLCPSFPTID